MAQLHRIRVTVAGFDGGPGVATFYCVDSTTFLAPLRAFIAFMSGYYPPTVTYTFPVTGDIIDTFTGQIVEAWNAPPQAAVVGTGVGKYAAPVGYSVRWSTSAFLSGRRLRGRTFFVPAVGDAFDTNGSLVDSAVAAIQTSATNLIGSTGGNFAIWQRPRLARAATGTLPAQAARTGGFGTVSGATVADKAAVLRSRRD